MTRRVLVRNMATALLLVVTVSAGCWLWGHRHYAFKNNFRVVEPGRVYAGGYQYSMPLREIINQYHIKTVLSLRESGDSHEREEMKVLAAKGVQFRNVALPFKVPDEERIAKIEQAIAVITDPENQPVYVHCWAGRHRAGIVVAIYRLSHGGWSDDAAYAELVQYGGTSQNTHWPTRTFHAYCSQHPAPVPNIPISGREVSADSNRF